MTAAVELEGASVIYDTPHGEVRALNDVTVGFASGTSTAILGRSGSGKSTLLSVLAHLRRLSLGTIRVGGVETQQLSEVERARLRGSQIAVVFQSFHLEPSLSVVDNVLLGWFINSGGVSYGKARQRAATDLLGLGLECAPDSHINTLSGGQRQRLAIARALFWRPQILLADEPTGALDEETASDVVAALVEPTKTHGTCLIMVTHDDAVAREADRVITLSRGRLTSMAGA